MLFYFPCSVYLLSRANALRTRKAHAYFHSHADAFLLSLFSLFAFSLASALRMRKVHVYFLSCARAFLLSLFGLFAFSHMCFKNEEGSCIFPFSCTHFSTFPVQSIPFSRMHFKNEEDSYISFLLHKLFYFPCSVYLLSVASALRRRKVHAYFLSYAHVFLPSLFGLFHFLCKCFKSEEDSCIFPLSCTC